jgi:hypothetical protein
MGVMLAAAVDPDSAEPVTHLMTPTAVAVLLLMALTLDYMTVGPAWLRDRAAFLFALVAIREGFNGSPLDAWTVGALSSLVQNLLDSTGGAYIAGAAVNVVLGAAVACVGVYVIGQMMPVKFAKRLGRFAALKFRPSPTHQLNVSLWVCAGLLGLMLDLPGGGAGVLLRWLYDLDLHLVAPLPGQLFGGA